ncbi:nucleoside/nucleotide kinase family protein [Actinacidiphila alni]|uniref:nucleoside/nucleotide kinase family protein n=1 Tax=Actinacidiphila alni TaxID=380248 RepID=UPI003453A7C9
MSVAAAGEIADHGPLAPLYAQPSRRALAERALGLVGGGRALLGIVGEPGAGKSTFAEQLLAEVATLRPGAAVGVSMDGFHLAQQVIDRQGKADRKGAVDTFDARGFVAMLRRTAGETDQSVWWPEFRREIEEPVAQAVEVTPAHRLVVVDGNFLLTTDPPWHEVRDLLTETWFLDADPGPRRERLVRRYIRYGFGEESARAKTEGIDEITSAHIRRTCATADLTLHESGRAPGA